MSDFSKTVEAIDNLSPQERVQQINALRSRILNGEKLPLAEIQRGVRLLAGDRAHRVANAGSRGKAKAKTEAATKAASLFGDL